MNSAAPIVLDVSHYMPPGHGTHVDFIAPWATEVEIATSGAVRVRIHTGETQLGLLDNQYAQVTSGTVDVAHSPAALPPGRFPLTSLLGLPFMTASAEQGTRLLWALLDPHLIDEYADLHVLALHVDSGGALHTRDRLITRLEQLEGMRLRCPGGPMEATLRRLGAIPVPLTPPNIRAAAQAGEIDGALMAWDVIVYTQTDAIFRFHTDTKLYASPLYFVMNRARWLGLPKPVRAAIDRVSGPALVERFGAWWRRWEAPGRSTANARGHTVTELSPAELERWRRAAEPAIESHVDGLVRAGLANARDVYEAALVMRGSLKGS